MHSTARAIFANIKFDLLKARKITFLKVLGDLLKNLYKRKENKKKIN